MLVLRDGTQIYDEFTLREHLENHAGFDCWKSQKEELHRLLTSYDCNDDDDLVAKVESLEQDILDLSEDKDDLEAEVEELEDKIREKNKLLELRKTQIGWLLEKLDDAGIDPFKSVGWTNIDRTMDELKREREEGRI